MTITAGSSRLVEAVEALRERVSGLRLPLATSGAEHASLVRDQVVAQLDDYVLPRLREIDAPLLAVVGGSTGAGKSTLVNSLVDRVVSRTGVLRPTTRSPILVHHPDDTTWFAGDRVLPSLPRVTGEAGDPGALHLVSDEQLGAGLALLDAPDIDSVVDDNRRLAAELLAAADLWVFVTTAARYADAVPWGFLREAAERSAVVAVVLNRVPPKAITEVMTHLAEMLASHGLGDAPLFTVPEVELAADGLIRDAAMEPLRDWLADLAADAGTRREVVRRTLAGAIGGMLRRVPLLAEAADEQATTYERLRSEVDGAYDNAEEAIHDATADGSLLRGEVLARWQDFVGTGEFLRSLEATVGKLRDRISAALRGEPAPAEQVSEAIGVGVESVVIDAADRAAERTARQWAGEPAGAALLASTDEELARSAADLHEHTTAEIRAWQGAVLDLVREEGAKRKGVARALALGFNGLAVALMILVFASTAFIPTGAELAVGGGTAVVGQRLLEAVFGDEAVRRLADKARRDLHARLDRLLDSERERFVVLLHAAAVDPDARRALDAAAAVVEAAR